MRKYLYILFLLVSTIALGQRSSNQTIKNLQVSQTSKLIGAVTIGSSSFDASSVLGITSTTKGLLIPRMTTGQRDAISAPTTSLMIYNTTTNQFEFFETTWQAVGGGGGNTIYSADDNLAGDRIVTMGANSLTFDGNLTTLKGVDATGTNFAFKVQDNVGTELFDVRNDGIVTANDIISFADLGNTNAYLAHKDAITLTDFALAQGPTGTTLINAASGKSIFYRINNVSKGSMNVTEFNYNSFTVGDLFGAGSMAIAHSSMYTTTNYAFSQGGTGSTIINTKTGQRIDFRVNNSEKMRMTTDGNFGINETIPAEKLHVNGNAVVSGNMGIGTSSITGSTALDVTSTTGAILFPRMTTAQRDALTAVNGMVVYNSTLDKLQVRAAGAWVSLH